MPSCIASSFSQGEAFISSKPERTTTLTSSPPRRRAVRQQSIAVLPPPSTTTRLPILSIWPNETLESQSMPIWMLRRGLLAAREVEVAAARRAGADEDRVVRPRRGAPSGFRCVVRSGYRCCRCRRCSRPPRRSPPRAGGSAGSGCGSCRRRARSPSKMDDLVAERREVAGDRQRGRPGADQRDALAVPCHRGLGQEAARRRPCCRRRPASAGRSPPARPRRGRAGRPARRGGRRCGRGFPGKTFERQLTM